MNKGEAGGAACGMAEGNTKLLPLLTQSGPVTAWLQTHPACCGHLIFFFFHLTIAITFPLHIYLRSTPSEGILIVSLYHMHVHSMSSAAGLCTSLTVGVISSVLSPLLFQGALSTAVVEAHI